MAVTYDPNEDVFHLPIGRFIRAFTGLEYWLYHELLHIADISPDIGKALFSGTRADGITTNIRRCHEAKKLPIDPLLEKVMTHAGLLNSARNDVVHMRYFQFYDQPTYMSNVSRTLPAKAKRWVITADLLEDLWLDAQLASEIMMARIQDRNAKQRPVSAERWKELDRPWRYKSPSPASSRHMSPDSTPKRKRRPKPSPE